MNAAQFLAKLREGGAIVSSSVCHPIELANAKATGNFFVDAYGLAYVWRTAEWLESREDAFHSQRTLLINKESKNSENTNQKYKLEKSEDSTQYFIKIGGESYRAGYREAIANSLVNKLNQAHRPNLEAKIDGLYVCWNEHDKHEGCKMVREIIYF